jgi:hypothetical protein
MTLTSRPVIVFFDDVQEPCAAVRAFNAIDAALIKHEYAPLYPFPPIVYTRSTLGHPWYYAEHDAHRPLPARLIEPLLNETAQLNAALS